MKNLGDVMVAPVGQNDYAYCVFIISGPIAMAVAGPLLLKTHIFGSFLVPEETKFLTLGDSPWQTTLEKRQTFPGVYNMS